MEKPVPGWYVRGTAGANLTRGEKSALGETHAPTASVIAPTRETRTLRAFAVRQ